MRCYQRCLSSATVGRATITIILQLMAAHAQEPTGDVRFLAAQRVTVSGKLFSVGGSKWYLKGLVYGPFRPNSHGLPLPERPQLLRDLAHMRELGANCIRVYHPPPI